MLCMVAAAAAQTRQRNCSRSCEVSGQASYLTLNWQVEDVICLQYHRNSLARRPMPLELVTECSILHVIFKETCYERGAAFLPAAVPYLWPCTLCPPGASTRNLPGSLLRRQSESAPLSSEASRDRNVLYRLTWNCVVDCDRSEYCELYWLLIVKCFIFRLSWMRAEQFLFPRISCLAYYIGLDTSSFT